jgi:ribonuclease E
MATRMLIDARHPEETRVAVLKGNRIDEFDFESADRKQIKGNIYLAKVTRVEPSLQAAFVDFGGNRHGFLAFSEIHPDYYQIPKQDREALLAEEAAHAEEEAALRASEGDDDDDDDDHDHGDHADDDMHDNGGVTEVDTSEKDEVATIDGGTFENGEDEDEGESEGEDGNRRGRGRRRQSKGRSKEADELRAKRMALRRRYKIQDVIHRRQVLLVQVVKEERGNKGAALTTYLSLAGRYCVLMPNSSHGGGISRKISSASDRKRLKQIISEMQLPRSMGCIVRTAGLSRTKTEIKRDFDYLARLWDDLRESTLRSSAPALIHSDSDLIKRAIRDIYNRDIEEVVVEGEEGYRAAKDFMKLLMPSHGRKVKPYSDPVPLFQRYGAEDQLTAMYDPVVQLKSGGYIVINPTEALVSIDINSGRSTKEYGIEATALNTNLEAAHEIARQLRLRDMAGLVVIDFIDMEYGSNVRKVEKAVKDALKNDRARIQVGRISSFGLMEMSRQRLRTGVLEATTRSCPHCDGTGLVRTASSAGLSALRLIEDEAAKGRGSIITLFASTEAAVYMLNAKRSDLADIEFRYGVSVEVIPEGENEGAKMRVASSGPRLENPPVFQPIIDLDEDDEDYPEEDEIDEAEEAEANAEASSDDAAGRKRRKRRRGGRNRDRRDERDAEGGQDAESEDDADAEGDTDQDGEATGGAAPEGDGETVSEDGEAPRKRRRRGGRRRRGRGRGEDNGEGQVEGEAGEQNFADGPEPEAEPEAEPAASESVVAEEAAEAPAKPRRTRRRKAEPVEEAAAPEATPVGAAPVEETAAEAPAEKPKRTRRKKADVAALEAVAAPEPEAPVEAAEKPKRGRRKKADTAEAAPETAPEAEAASDPLAEEPAAKPKRTRRAKAVAADAPAEPTAVAPADAPNETQPVGSGERNDDEEGEDGQPRRGWWQRTFGN